MPKEVQADLGLTPEHLSEQGPLEMAKSDRNGQMASAAKELERLRLLQGEIEKKHVELGELGHKQDAYQRAKREIAQGLDRALVSLEKQSAECVKSQNLIDETRQAFRARLLALKSIEESSWDGADFEESLNRAFGIVDEAETVYTRGLSKVGALVGVASAPTPSSGVPLTSSAPSVRNEVFPRGFLFWLKAGFAFTLPLILAVFLLCIVLLFLNGY